MRTRVLNKNEVLHSGLTQPEFVHRSMTLPSGRLRPRVNVKAYKMWMQFAKAGLLIEEIYDYDFVYGTPAQRALLMPRDPKHFLASIR